MKMFHWTVATMAGVIALQSQATGAWANEEPIVWRYYTAHSEDRDVFEVQQDWADMMTEATDGRLKVEIYPGGALGFKVADILGALKGGLVESAFIYGGYYSRDEPVLSLVMPQMVFNTREEFLALTPTAYDLYEELYDEWDVEVSSMWPTLTCNVAAIGEEPFGSVEDMKGKRIRVWEAQQVNTLEKLGVAAVVIPQNDLYLAMKTGTVDGTIHFPQSMKDLSLAEDAKYFSLVQPAPVVQGIGISEQALNALPGDLREIVLETSEAHREKWQESAQNCLAEDQHIEWAVEQGVERLPDFSNEDRNLISEAAIEVWQERAKEVGPKAEEYQQRMEEALMEHRGAAN